MIPPRTRGNSIPADGYTLGATEFPCVWCEKTITEADDHLVATFPAARPGREFPAHRACYEAAMRD